MYEVYFDPPACDTVTYTSHEGHTYSDSVVYLLAGDQRRLLHITHTHNYHLFVVSVEV